MRLIPTQLWNYNARPYDIFGVASHSVDGDTVEFMIDRGMHEYAYLRLRLLGINAPEVHGNTKILGLAAKQYTINWLQAAIVLNLQWPLRIHTEKDDSFGRYLAYIWRLSDEHCLNDDLLESGNAVTFMVEKTLPSRV